MRPRVESDYDRLERTVFAPLQSTTRSYYMLVGFLLTVIAWGLYAFAVQIHLGLSVTGMGNIVVWGFYLVNFVFFIGISHAGTLISAILRVSGAAWRTPVTRMAELITVVAISIGALMPIIDMGRPDRVINMFTLGRFQSPLMWDIISITTYLTGSLVYFYLPMIPDIAIMRDRLAPGASSLKRRIYTILAAGWQGTAEQKHRLEKAITIMAITIIPIAISVHTVVAYVYSMNLRPGWDSTVFGVYFVVGAIFSGIASILIVMAIFRKLFHFEEYITERHFKNLSLLLLTTLFFYLYLTIGEYVTVGYKMKPEERHLLELLLTGQNAFWFWFFVIFGQVVPALLIIVRKGKMMPRILAAAVMINISMWIKRFIIMIPTLQVPLLPFEFGTFSPTWVEWSITAAAFAAFILIFTLAAKFVPLISIWEVAEEQEHEGAQQKVNSFVERLGMAPRELENLFNRLLGERGRRRLSDEEEV
jgi:molybdopterin-containing oxidoreductase family membrane subunit